MAASGTSARVAYSQFETTHGTTPASPQFTVLRAISRNINLKKAALESAETRQTRQRADVRHGFNQVEGAIQVELAMEAHNDWLLASVGTNAWYAATTVLDSVDPLGITASSIISRATGNWFDDQYRPGDWIQLTGWTNGGNNIACRITTMNANGLSITVAQTLIDEVATGAAQVAYIGKKCSISSLAQSLKSWTIEREILDLDAAGIDLWQIFKGVAVNSLTVSAQPDALLLATFNLIGMAGSRIDNAATTDTSGGYTDPAVSSVGSPPLAGIDTTFYLGASSYPATGFEMTIDNQRTLVAELGKATSSDIYEGVAKVSGSLNVMLASVLYPQRFQDETVSQGGFQIRANELGSSNFMTFNCYSVKFMSNEIDPPPNGPVIQTVNWEALQRTFPGASTSYLETMHIQRSTTT